MKDIKKQLKKMSNEINLLKKEIKSLQRRSIYTSEIKKIILLKNQKSINYRNLVLAYIVDKRGLSTIFYNSLLEFKKYIIKEGIEIKGERFKYVEPNEKYISLYLEGIQKD